MMERSAEVYEQMTYEGVFGLIHDGGHWWLNGQRLLLEMSWRYLTHRESPSPAEWVWL